jgi:hypothetical protein
VDNEHQVEAEEYVSIQTKLSNFVRKNVFNIAIAFVCLMRIVYGLTEIEKTGNSISVIIADSAISFVFSVILCRLFEGKGLSAGENSKMYQESLEKYQKAKEGASQWIGKLDGWCKQYTKKRYVEKMSAKLLPLGLTYEQYTKHDFDESKFTDTQKKRFDKLKNVKVQTITTEILMSGESESEHEDINDKKATKKAFVRRSTSSGASTKIILSLLFGYFTLPPIVQWNWAGAIWALLHTALMLGLSVISYFSAYSFMNEMVLAKLVDKTNKLNLFIKEQKESEQQTNQD